ncbi:hypothetical protein AAG570_012820 [Ranatra chinensis]|uniref:Uncharacterized protein n=1 Tax=Ranatra chinensis TaxID=642074 RepID=A0ABD0YF91_9HEMI
MVFTRNRFRARDDRPRKPERRKEMTPEMKKKKKNDYFVRLTTVMFVEREIAEWRALRCRQPTERVPLSPCSQPMTRFEQLRQSTKYPYLQFANLEEPPPPHLRDPTRR